jgi:carboxyl-terminal processing protease
MTRGCTALPARILLAALVVLLFLPTAWAQFSRVDRDRAEMMLNVVAADVRENYYDPKLHGVDWEAHVRQAKEGIAKAASVEEATMQIADLLAALNDSHTMFIPPRYATRVEYGWQFQMVGNRCFVTRVRPGSDAEVKGIHPGDEVTSIDRFVPDRDGILMFERALGMQPQRVLQLGLVDALTGKPRSISVESKVIRAQTTLDKSDMERTMGREVSQDAFKPRVEEMGPELMIVKFRNFVQPGYEVEGLLEKAAAHKTLIVDLRGNTGGREETLQAWIGGLFENDIKIADRVRRKKTESFIAKGRRHPYTGKVIVLTDSNSASAAEIFARVIQLEKRGIVMGDQSAGATMESKGFIHRDAGNRFVNAGVMHFGAMITEAELLMSDGQSLEHNGVVPDEMVLPAPLDMANQRDPVMSRAAAMAGVKLSPEEAGKLFPYEWVKDWTYLH